MHINGAAADNLQPPSPFQQQPQRQQQPAPVLFPLSTSSSTYALPNSVSGLYVQQTQKEEEEQKQAVLAPSTTHTLTGKQEEHHVFGINRTDFEQQQHIQKQPPPLKGPETRSSSPSPMPATNADNNEDAVSVASTATASTTTNPPPPPPSRPSFKELEQHIGELTELKFALQRRLEQQTVLTDRLAEENEALTVRINTAARAVDGLKKELHVRQQEVAVAREEVGRAMAERDAYEMSAREGAQRANMLAVEVVGLEERVLKLKSEQLKLLSSARDGGSDRGSDRRSGGKDSGKDSEEAAELREQLEAAHRGVEVMRQQMEGALQGMSATQEEMNVLKRERMDVERELDVIRSEIEVVKKERDEAVQRVMTMTVTMMEGGGEGEGLDARASATTAGAPEKEEEQQEEENEDEKALHRQNDANKPPPSALFAAEAMLEEKTANDAAGVESSTSTPDLLPCIPPEIKALLPPAVWTPGSEGVDPGVHSLVNRIYQIVDVLEAEKKEAAQALDAQKKENEEILRVNASLQRRLESVRQGQELEAQRMVSRRVAEDGDGDGEEIVDQHK